MFSSLDRIDVELDPRSSVGARYVQTDHRTPQEIDAELDLSILFAVLRVVNPRRSGPGPVLYQAAHRPPLALERALRAAGASLAVGEAFDKPLPVSPGVEPLPALQDVVDQAFAGLARTQGVAQDLDGLRRLEERLWEQRPDLEADEPAYWAAVVGLGGFAGELIRANVGGRWNVDPAARGTLPIEFLGTVRGEPATLNPLGKAIKFLKYGPGDEPSSLVQMLMSPA